jgi:two-component system capsular synthesis sensor histidine kinase RcsC
MNWNLLTLFILLVISSGIVAGLIIFILSKFWTGKTAPVQQIRPAQSAAHSDFGHPLPLATVAPLRSDFLAKVSHELRTPLTSILGVTEMLEYGVYGPLSREQKEALHLITESSQQMVRLVNDLLEQSRLDRGGLQLDISEFVVQDLINRLRMSLVQVARSKGLSFTCSVDPNVPLLLRGDVLRIYQILRNLADNAIKYTNKGAVSVQVWRSGENEYVFEVSDTGIGIPKELQPLIYEPFLRLNPAQYYKSNGNGNGNGNANGNGNGNGQGFGNGNGNGYGSAEGFGLGLAIVKQLVALMDGDIKLESEVGRGSKFTVRLHLEPARVQA